MKAFDGYTRSARTNATEDSIAGVDITRRGAVGVGNRLDDEDEIVE